MVQPQAVLSPMSPCPQDTAQPQAVAAIFAQLDANGDRRISFDEYWQLVAWLCHVLRQRRFGASPAPPPPAFTGDSPHINVPDVADANPEVL